MHLIPLLLLAAAAQPALPSPSEAAAVARPPRPTRNLASLVRDDDLPREAIGSGGGIVRFLLSIGANGRVEDCRVTASSGVRELDQVTCRIVRARARFEPARDSSDAPMRATYADEMQWWLSR